MDPSAVRTWAMLMLTCGAGAGIGLSVAAAAVPAGTAVVTGLSRAGEVADALAGLLLRAWPAAGAAVGTELHAAVTHKPAAAAAAHARRIMRSVLWAGAARSRAGTTPATLRGRTC
ncbi:MAG TPA: hypothetical protein VEF71_10810 [Streptosporangiaceae bacterium]|nr:hypothetical protein [Streptosporangiaceae bacterium]